ncbi:hypothetical protein BGZ57DRAFT_1004838 [Hyaloscypha finlandica]|nr:hypothetical protein BGZ57DRAFT_1004838 [Hyaloscypha finlandica]
MPRDRRPLDRRVGAAIRNFSPLCRWLPTRPRSSLAFTILVLCIVCLILQFGFWEDKFPVQSGFVYRLKDGNQSHPVEYLHAAAKKQFDALLARQSTTPPLGMPWSSTRGDDEVARAVLEDGADRRGAPDGAQRLPRPGQTRGYIKKCFIAMGKLKDCGAWADVMSRYLGVALRGIPNITFLANYMDEPAVLPRDPIVSPSDSGDKFLWSSGPSRGGKGGASLRAQRHAGDGPMRTPRVPGDSRLSRLGRELVPYLPCRTHPVPRRAAPLWRDLVPGAKLLVVPVRLQRVGDRSWRRKTAALYWAGSNTGSYTHDETWRRHHRQRLVLLALGADQGTEFTYLSKAGGGDSWIPFTTSRFDKSLYHVTMTRIWACDEPACREQNAEQPEG